MTKAIIAAAIFLACLAPLGCDWADVLDDQCLRYPDSEDCTPTTLEPLEVQP